MVGEKIDVITVQYEDITKFLGLKKMDIEKFILIMREFYMKTFEALKSCKERKVKEEKWRQNKEEQNKSCNKKKNKIK